MGIWQKSVFLCSLAATSLYGVSSKGSVYSGNDGGGQIVALDPTTGNSRLVATLPENIAGLSLLNSTTLYVLTGTAPFGQNHVWSVNTQTGATQLVTPTSLGLDFPLSIAVADSSTAYIADYIGNKVVSVNLQTGASATIVTIPNSPTLTDIAIGNNSTAYVCGQSDGNVYAVNLQTGTYTQVTPNPIQNGSNPGLFGIALANNNLAYVFGDSDSNLYSVDLQTGAFSLVTSTPLVGSEIINLCIPNNTTAYTIDDDATPPTLYIINIPSGNNVKVSFPAFSSFGGFWGVDIQQQMGTAGLTGNNLSLASYINNNATIDTIRLFALLPDSELPRALESISPARNAFATFAAQNGYLATSQVVADHSRQKRFFLQTSNSKEIASGEIPTDELLADASDDAYLANFIQSSRKTCARKKENVCNPKDPYTVWAAGFGEYAREKSQKQTPAFKMGVGGAIVGFDLNTLGDHMLGFGAAYVHTHVHENKKAGHANVNQGFLTTYGTLNATDWYFDLGLWGGYYHIDNHRRISFPFFKGTAKSSTHGWQLAPHFEVGYDGFQYNKYNGTEYGFEPFLMADWVANWERGFREHGAGVLDMHQKGRFSSLFRGETGLRLNQVAKLDWGRIVFLEKASYAYQKAFHTGSITAFIVGLPGSFSVSTLAGAQNLGVAEFSMLFIFNNPNAPYFDLRYQGEFGSHYQSHQGVIEIGKDF